MQQTTVYNAEGGRRPAYSQEGNKSKKLKSFEIKLNKGLNIINSEYKLSLLMNAICEI